MNGPPSNRSGGVPPRAPGDYPESPDPRTYRDIPPEPLDFGHVVVDVKGRSWVRTYPGKVLRPAWANGHVHKHWWHLKLPETPSSKPRETTT